MKNNNQTKFTIEPGKQELSYTREFDAPRENVFRAFTDPRLYPEWIGPRGLTTRLETFEPKDGGKWRFTQKDQENNEYGFHGVYHEVKAPERIVDTFEFEGEAGHVILETLIFEALPGYRTKVSVQAVHQSVADRDKMLQSGAESGVIEGYERLDELLTKI